MNELNVNIGDTVQMKKPHPCGSFVWKIIRFGADVKLECIQCGKVVMLERIKFYKRVKKVVEKSSVNG